MENSQIIIGGSAGEGSKKAGLIIAKVFNAYGYRVFIHEDYHSLIRGGHNFSQISISDKKKIEAKKDKIDYLLALNEDSIEIHLDKLKEGGVLIYDSDLKSTKIEERNDVKKIEISSNEIINENNGDTLMKNTVIISVFFKTIGIDRETVMNIVAKEFSGGIEKNIEIVVSVFDRTESVIKFTKTGEDPLPLVTGNQAVALGAIRAGLEVYIAYPMTPSTGVLSFLSSVEGVKTVQPENELSVVNMAIGSAYSGRRTMVGTSGGGFALMTESISLSAISETPLVVVLSQRMGPASGVPTYQSQGDLLFALHSGHGDMDRLVVAPGDADEAYYLSGVALNLAWKYQLPAIILLDKELSENTYGLERKEEVCREDEVVGVNDNNYKRYDGEDISPLLHPGGEAVVKATSYEHTKDGIVTERPEDVKNMQDKRLKKAMKLKEEIEGLNPVKVYKEGKVAVVFWGSTKGAIVEATKDMDVKLIQPIFMQPFPDKKMKEALSNTEKTICVEMNRDGQLAKVMKSHGINTDEKILKYDSRPFTIEELKEKLQEKINF